MSDPLDPLVTKNWAAKAIIVRARMQIDKVDIKQADIGSISYKVYEKSSGDVINDSGTFSVATTIFDAVQSDADGKYNFKGRLPGSNFPTALEYRVVITFVPADTNIDPIDFVIDHDAKQETPPIS